MGVGLKIRGPANFAGAWSAQPVPASPRPPRGQARRRARPAFDERGPRGEQTGGGTRTEWRRSMCAHERGGAKPAPPGERVSKNLPTVTGILPLSRELGESSGTTRSTSRPARRLPLDERVHAAQQCDAIRLPRTCRCAHHAPRLNASRWQVRRTTVEAPALPRDARIA